MLRLFYFLFAIIISISSYSQGNVSYSDSPNKINSKVEFWFTGTAVLADETELYANMAYNPLIPGGLLKIKTGSQIKTLTPRQVKRFFYYDSLQARNRTFYSIASARNNNQFIELLTEGHHLSLLGRETVKVSQWTSYNYTSSDTRGIYQLILYDNKDGSSILLGKKSLLQKMSDKKIAVKDFLKAERINLKDPKDAIKVVDYYNTLTEE